MLKVPYLLGMPGLSPLLGVPRLWGRSSPAWTVGTGLLSLRERQELLLVVASTLAPKSIPRLQGSGLVLTLGVEGFGMDRRLKQPRQWEGTGAAQWEPQCWLRHGPLCLLVAKDSLVAGCWLLFGGLPGRNVGAPCAWPRPQ